MSSGATAVLVASEFLYGQSANQLPKMDYFTELELLLSYYCKERMIRAFLKSIRVHHEVRPREFNTHKTCKRKQKMKNN